MNTAQKQVKKLNKKMVKSYSGTFLRNFYRRRMNSFSRTLRKLADIVSRKERNPKTVLKNYDQIAGVYVDSYNSSYKSPKELLILNNGQPELMMSDVFLDNKVKHLVDDVFSLPGISSVVEIGAGEATTLAPVLQKMSQKYEVTAALDLSWSRMAVARKFASSLDVNIDHFVVGDAYHLPFADNSFDLVYTYHCLEQMPFHKEQSLFELYRVSRKYLVLIEPSYEFGNLAQRLRWRNKNYIKGIPKTIKKLGFDLKKHDRIPFTGYPNSAAIHLIEKNENDHKYDHLFICPESKKPLKLLQNHYFCPENGVVYPMIGGVALLDKQNAIIASKYEDMCRG